MEVIIILMFLYSDACSLLMSLDYALIINHPFINRQETTVENSVTLSSVGNSAMNTLDLRHT